MNIKQAAQAIRDTVTMDQILQLYGYTTKRGFMRCPFHGEKTASLKVYRGTGGWHWKDRNQQIREDHRRFLADFCFHAGAGDCPVLQIYLADLQPVGLSRHHAGVDHQQRDGRPEIT